MDDGMDEYINEGTKNEGSPPVAAPAARTRPFGQDPRRNPRAAAAVSRE